MVVLFCSLFPDCSVVTFSTFFHSCSLPLWIIFVAVYFNYFLSFFLYPLGLCVCVCVCVCAYNESYINHLIILTLYFRLVTTSFMCKNCTLLYLFSAHFMPMTSLYFYIVHPLTNYCNYIFNAILAFILEIVICAPQLQY